MKYKWVSFSLDGENQGVCNIEASSRDGALEKCQDLGIVPTYDDILILSIPKPELPLDRLVSRDKMLNSGYRATDNEDVLDSCKNMSKTLDAMEN